MHAYSHGRVFPNVGKKRDSKIHLVAYDRKGSRLEFLHEAGRGEEAFRARHGERLSRVGGERRRRDYSEESGGSTPGALVQTMKEALLHLHLLTDPQTEQRFHLVAADGTTQKD